MAKPFEEQLQRALDKADHTFWVSIAESFPDVKSGDFPPEASHMWNQAVERAVLTWLMYNHPTEPGREKARQLLRRE